ANTAVQNSFTQEISAPIDYAIQYTRSGLWNTRRADNQALGAFAFGLLTGAESQIDIVAGEWPTTATLDEGVIPVLLAEEVLYTLGLQVGDKLTIQRPAADPIQAQIVALWRAKNPTDPAWIFRPSYFNNALLVQAEDFAQIVDGLERPIEEAAW